MVCEDAGINTCDNEARCFEINDEWLRSLRPNNTQTA